MKRVPSILRRRRPAAEERSSLVQSAFGSAYAAPTLAGVAVTPHSALTLSAYFAAINVISRDVASMSLDVYKIRPDGGKEVDDSRPVQELLSVSPDGERNAARYRQMSMGHTLGHGNTYSEIQRTQGGEPYALHPLDPSTTHPARTKAGRLVYRIENGREIPSEDVLHVAGLSFDGITGYSPAALMREAIGLGKGAEQWGATVFGNGAIPRGVIKSKKTLSPEARRNMRQSWNEIHQGSRHAHNIAILEEDTEFLPINISAEDAQFLATRAFQVLEVARMFSIPPHKIGDYSQAHLANVEEANLDYFTTTLLGWLVAIEAEFNRKLLSAADRKSHVIAHNMASLLRGNSVARVQYYKALADMGVITPNDVARFESLNPIGPDGDKRLVPLNMTTLAQAGAPAPRQVQ